MIVYNWCLHLLAIMHTELIYIGIVSNKEAGESTTLVQQDESRTRVASYHMRELAKGNFLVTKKDITLMDCIGEGKYNNIKNKVNEKSSKLFYINIIQESLELSIKED